MADLGSRQPRWGFGEVLRLSMPAGMSMLGWTVTMFVDGVMLARLGPREFVAQSTASLVAFVPASFAVGVLGVVNTFVSQNLGAGKKRRCGQYSWAGMVLVGAFCLLVVPLAMLGGPLFAAIGHEPAVQGGEVLFFRYMMLSLPVTLTVKVLEGFFYGIHRPVVVFVAAVTANVINIVGDYGLIFGRLGMPNMGLEGAAVATVTCWCAQVTILMAAFLLPRFHLDFGTRHARTVRLSQCGDIVRIGWPAGVTFMIDVFTWSIFTVVLIGRFGTAHLTAANAAVRYMQVSFMPAVGISIAITAIVGRCIGSGQLDAARRRTHAAVIMAAGYMGACGLCFLVFRGPLIRVFVDVSPGLASAGMRASDILAIGGRMMICAAVFQMFDAINIVFSGALRGAGDTRWPMVAFASLAAVLLVGGGAAMVHWLPQLESLGPYIAATVYIVALGLVMAWRFESGAWLRIDLLGRAGSRQGAGEVQDRLQASTTTSDTL